MSDLDLYTTPLTVDEVRASIYSVLAAVGVSTTNWKTGAVYRTIITACALVLAALSRLTALVARSGFLQLSSGAWLTLCALYLFGVSRIMATFATGVVTLTNSGGGVYTIVPGALTVSNAATGKTYTNTAPISIGALATVVGVPIQAVEIGTASNANAGDITGMVTAYLGVTVTNPAVVLGSDDEQDSALQLRCTEKLGSLSVNGPLDGYSFAARSAGRDANGLPILITPANPGTAIGVNRVSTIKDGIGGIDAYVATATGGVVGTVDDLSTDLGVVDDIMQRYATPIGSTLRTHTATPLAVAVSYEIWLYETSLTDGDIQSAISSALAAIMPVKPIGGDVISGTGAVWASSLEAVIGSAAINGAPIGIFKTVISTLDTILAPNQVPTLGVVTPVGIHRVKRPGT